MGGDATRAGGPTGAGEGREDPYMIHREPPEPTVCPRCRVVYHDGRWHWAAFAPGKANRELCPACRRIQDGVPAGWLTLEGGFFRDHREEVMALVEHRIERQKAADPMKRLMTVEDRDNGTAVVTFTHKDLPRLVGEALKGTFQGELALDDSSVTDGAQAHWRR